MSETNGTNGNSKAVAWLMTIVGTLVTAGAIGWASGQAGATEKAASVAQEARDEAKAAKAGQDLVLFRLTVLESEQREQRKMLDKIWSRLTQGDRER